MTSLWIESAHQSLTGAEMCQDAIRTFQTEQQFFTVIASGVCSAPGGAVQIASKAVAQLEQGAPPPTVIDNLLTALPASNYVPLSILKIVASKAHLVECDAPPPFFARNGQLVLLPVIEEEIYGRLIRHCEFDLQDGDHIAMVSEGYIQASGWNAQGGWRGIALAIKRLTATRCDAEQLLGALIRSYHRLAQDDPARDVSVVAMFARPLRTATVWSGPPAKQTTDKVIFDKFMAAPGKRIICGDTSAEIAARFLGAEIKMEPPPEEGWLEVPPVSQLAGVDLVTEGLVTMGKARERMAQALRAQDLPRKEDGATRLARMLLNVDKIHFLIGLAVNPAQTADEAGTIPLRRIVIEDLMSELKARKKIISAEYF